MNYHLPYLGLTIKTITDSPKIEIAGYVFVGSWIHCAEGYKLIDINWQEKKTGKCINNDNFLEIIFF